MHTIMNEGIRRGQLYPVAINKTNWSCSNRAEVVGSSMSVANSDKQFTAQSSNLIAFVGIVLTIPRSSK